MTGFGWMARRATVRAVAAAVLLAAAACGGDREEGRTDADSVGTPVPAGVVTDTVVSSIPAAVRGEWRVTDHRARGISAMDEETAKGWSGSTASFSDTLTLFLNRGCARASYRTARMDGGEFLRANYRITPASMGWTDGEVEVVDVDCANGPAREPLTQVLRGPGGETYAVAEGVFFRLERP